MNIDLPFLPERTLKPRQTGIAMVMDKSLSVREAEDIVSVGSDYIDYIKLGFGTSLVTHDLQKKIKVYKEANIKVYLGGTLLKHFSSATALMITEKFIDQLGLDTIEISDGSMSINHDVKCEYINILSKAYTVLSEVGSKESGILISPGKWIEMMQKELQAGSFQSYRRGQGKRQCGYLQADRQGPCDVDQ